MFFVSETLLTMFLLRSVLSLFDVHLLTLNFLLYCFLLTLLSSLAHQPSDSAVWHPDSPLPISSVKVLLRIEDSQATLKDISHDDREDKASLLPVCLSLKKLFRQFLSVSFRAAKVIVTNPAWSIVVYRPRLI